MKEKTLEIFGKDFSEIVWGENLELEIQFLEEINSKLESGDYKVNRNRELDFRHQQETLKLYDRDRGRFGGIIGTIHNKNYVYRNQQYDASVMIKSRFDCEQNSYFMAEMMRSYFQYFYNITLTNDEIPLGYENIFAFLKICIFRKKLMKASECGFYRKYTYFKNNDSHLRGRIDVVRDIRQNMGLNNGKIAYEYREYTVDNSVNHLIILTYDSLKKEFPDMTDCILEQEEKNGISAYDIIQQLRYMAPGYRYSTLESVIQNARIPVTSAYFQEYEELRNSCIDILRGLNLSIYADHDSDEEVESMLFYVPDLWEIYIGSMLHRLCDELKFEFLSQDEVPPLKKKGEDNKMKIIGEMRMLRPDFVIKNEQGEVALLLDAKFKPSWKSFEEEINNTHNTIMDDIRSIFAYATLEEAQNVGVIFPVSEQKSSVTEYLIGNNNKVKFYVCSLEIPDCGSFKFSDWQKKMQENLGELKDKIRKDILVRV